LEKKIALAEVWLGKIPDYFKYHIETIGSMTSVDFYFFTNDIEYDFSNIKHSNFILNYITEEVFLERFNNISKIKMYSIPYLKKIIEFKLSYFDMFQDIIFDYDYIGWYDVDTMFGNINPLLLEYTKEYDFISVGDEIYHNRLSGPLLIMKNNEELRNLLRSNQFYETLKMDEIYGYAEQELSNIAMTRYNTKIIHSMNTEINNGGKTTYDVCWSGGKLIVNDEEKMIYHFIKKNHTIFQKIGNKIFGRYDKKFVEDFYWVFGFTENYSQTIPFLMDSINKYSNRKCVIYSINFDYNIPNKFLTSGQFIFKRIDIESGRKDSRGRDENIISCKPRLMLDVIDFLPNKKFIFIDSDVYLTTTSDDFGKYFNELEHYPLINQHTHDKLYLCNIIEGEKWTSTVDILAEATNTEVTVFPRRKTNVMLFDEKSKWFFQEQLQMYNKYKDSRPGIFTLHDEDSANVILSKYNLHKSLHLCDIEESSNINMSKFTDMNHPFHMTGLSDYLRLPNHQNDVVCFHGLKYDWQYNNIQNDYGNSVIDCEEILVYYNDNTISFEKNSFLTTKKIDENVDFIVKTIDGQIVTTLPNQNISHYWLFFISNIQLTDDYYIIEIIKTDSRVKIYNNLLKIR
jgi:hypothetical protein